MKTPHSPMFPRVRLLMMLFMLLSMAGSLSLTASAAPASTGSSGFGAFQTEPTVQICEALDTDDNLNLTNDEISQNKTDFNGDGQVNDADRDIISSYCVAAPSTPINFVTICHATQSETHGYEIITIRADAVISAHMSPQHQWGEDIIPPFTYDGKQYDGQGDQSWLENGCKAPEPEPEYGTVVVDKYFCVDENEDPFVVDPAQYVLTGCTEGTATFDIIQEGVSVGADLSTLFTTGVTLPVGDYVLVEYGDDDSVLLEYLFSVTSETTLTIPVVNPVEEQPKNGTVIVEKYYCEDDSIEAPVVGNEGDYENCVAGEGDFDLLDGEGASVLDEDDNLFAGVELPLGTYYLVEWFNGEWHDLATVALDEDGETIPYVVFNPVEPDEITIWIYKEVCADLKEIDPEHPKDPCVGWDDGLDGTVINFTVTVDDGDDAVEDEVFPASLTVVDGWGQTSVVVPEGVSYTVCEAVPDQVEELSFASSLAPTATSVDDGCITFAGADVVEAGEVHVLFQQTLKGEPEKPEKPEKPQKPKPPVKQVPPSVTGLPDTGSGTVDDASMAPWMLIASAAVLAGTSALLRKERPVA